MVRPFDFRFGNEMVCGQPFYFQTGNRTMLWKLSTKCPKGEKKSIHNGWGNHQGVHHLSPQATLQLQVPGPKSSLRDWEVCQETDGNTLCLYWHQAEQANLVTGNEECSFPSSCLTCPIEKRGWRLRDQALHFSYPRQRCRLQVPSRLILL
jgi:hypothetical protein